MGKGWQTIIVAGVSISVLCSIAAICISAPHIPQLGFDYQGILVGILSTLVTLLIGWQIYNIINIQSSLEKFTQKMSKIDEIEKRHNEMSIYIDAQISNLSAHSLYIQKRYVETLRCSFEALCKYSLIETYKDSPNCINDCLCNLASVLKDIRFSKDATVEIKIFNDVINRFRSTPPRFSTPTTNKNIQWLFVFISNRQKDIYNALPEEQWLELDAFIKNINSNTQ